jgi:hypothetical protein
LQKLQNRSGKNKEMTLECRTEAKQQENETKIYLTSRKTKSIKQKPIFEPISPATAPKT